MKLYLVILHDAEPPTEEGRQKLCDNLSEKLGLSQERVERIFKERPVVLKEGISQEAAGHYSAVLKELGANVEVMEDVSEKEDDDTLEQELLSAVEQLEEASEPSLEITEDDTSDLDLGFADELESPETSAEITEETSENLESLEVEDSLLLEPIEELSEPEDDTLSFEVEANDRHPTTIGPAVSEDDLENLAELEEPEDDGLSLSFDEPPAAPEVDLSSEEVLLEPDSEVEEESDQELDLGPAISFEQAEEPVETPVSPEEVPADEEDFLDLPELGSDDAYAQISDEHLEDITEEESASEPVEEEISYGVPKDQVATSAASPLEEQSEADTEEESQSEAPSASRNTLLVGIGSLCAVLILAAYFVPRLLNSDSGGDTELASNPEDLQLLLKQQEEIMGSNEQQEAVVAPKKRQWSGESADTPLLARTLVQSLDDSVTALELEVTSDPPPPQTDLEIVKGITHPWLKRFYATGFKEEKAATLGKKSSDEVDSGTQYQVFRASGRAYIEDDGRRHRIVADVLVRIERPTDSDTIAGHYLITYGSVSDESSALVIEKPSKGKYAFRADGSILVNKLPDPTPIPKVSEKKKKKKKKKRDKKDKKKK